MLAVEMTAKCTLPYSNEYQKAGWPTPPIADAQLAAAVTCMRGRRQNCTSSQLPQASGSAGRRPRRTPHQSHFLPCATGGVM